MEELIGLGVKKGRNYSVPMICLKEYLQNLNKFKWYNSSDLVINN